jgi:hypothetical protein
MSPKEAILLLLLLFVGVMMSLTYWDVYPPTPSDAGPAGDVDSGEITTEVLVDQNGDDETESTTSVADVDRTDWLAPGLSRNGLENPYLLGRGHRETLLEAGSWTQYSTTIVYANGTDFVSAEETAMVGANGTRAAGSVDMTGENTGRYDLYGPDLDYWANERTAYVRFPDSGRTSEINRDDRYPVPYDVESTQWRYHYRLFAQMNTTYAGSVQRDGATFYRVIATKAWYYDSPFGDVRDVTLSAMVTSEGLIAEYVLSYVKRTVAGLETRVVVHVRYTDVGTTTIERPDWVPGEETNATATSPPGTEARNTSIARSRPGKT